VALGPPPPAYAGLAGVAAQLAHPDRRVVAFTSAAAWVAGERALGLATALRLPLIVVVVDALAEGDFAAAFARAFQARGPAVVAGAGR
jgi:thiamine pyrophosphate-dependent acetolactate synthase large subunit-like protein